jgi:hypothetical protein
VRFPGLCKCRLFESASESGTAVSNSRYNVATKRGQKKACFHYAERKQHRRWLASDKRVANEKLVFQLPEKTCSSHFHRQSYE